MLEIKKRETKICYAYVYFFGIIGFPDSGCVHGFWATKSGKPTVPKIQQISETYKSINIILILVNLLNNYECKKGILISDSNKDNKSVSKITYFGPFDSSIIQCTHCY